MKSYFDRRTRPVQFEPGDLVLVYNSALKHNMESKFKLSPPWFGPFRIHARVDNTYTLCTLSGDVSVGKFHAIRLKKFHVGMPSEDFVAVDNTLNLDI